MKYKKNPDIIYEKIDDLYILFNTQTEEFYELNSLGSLIWENIDLLSIEEIVNKIVNIYDVDYDKVFADVQEFISNLLQNKILFEVFSL